MTKGERRYRSSVDFDEHSQAAAGTDLYPRNLKSMPHGKTDHHCATVFKIPVNEVRARRHSLRYRFFKLIGIL